MALTNGDFETGDFTGWTPYASDVVVISSDKHGGTYSCQLGPAGYTFDDQWFIQQTVSLTDIETITFWREWPDATANFHLYVYRDPMPGYGITGGTKLWEEHSGTSGDWGQISIDISSLGLSGDHLLSFCLYFNGPGLSPYPKYVLLDDIIVSIPEVTPVAAFTQDKITGGIPCTVQFTDTSTNTPTAWSWDFDDGSAPDTTQSPEHVFTDMGAFHVTLTASNGGGSDVSDATTITATAGPVASFTVAFNGDIVVLTNTTTGYPTPTYDWDFGDGSIHATTTNASHKYPKSGG